MQTLTDMNQTELETHIDEVHEELFNLKIRHSLNQLDNPVHIRNLRRDLARVKTLIHEAKKS